MKKFLIVLGVLGIIAVLYFIFSNKGGDSVIKEPTKNFVSSEHRISFEYPNLYYLEEKALGTGEREKHQIILTEDTQENKDVREGRLEGREGPTAITITMYQNNLDNLSAEDFIKNTNDSNYKLSTGELSPEVKGNLQGVAYGTTGLYESKSFVVSKPDYIYHFSVTYMNTTDRILLDFENLITSAVIQ